MVQMYLLSVVTITIGSVALAGDYLAGKKTSLKPIFDIIGSKNARWGIGSIAIIIGIFKMIFRSPGEDVRVVGDLLPALAGIGVGALLLFSAFHREPEGDPQTKIALFVEKALRRRAYIGLLGMLVSIVHFLFPGVLIL